MDLIGAARFRNSDMDQSARGSFASLLQMIALVRVTRRRGLTCYCRVLSSTFAMRSSAFRGSGLDQSLHVATILDALTG
jgi:hypothetical protein